MRQKNREIYFFEQKQKNNSLNSQKFTNNKLLPGKNVHSFHERFFCHYFFSNPKARVLLIYFNIRFSKIKKKLPQKQ